MHVTKKYTLFVLVILLGIALMPSVARSQQATSRHPLEPSDTSSPAATLTSLIDALGREQTAGRPLAENAAAAYGDLISIWVRRHVSESDSPRDTAARR